MRDGEATKVLRNYLCVLLSRFCNTFNVPPIGRPGQDYTCARHAESIEERWEANICIVGGAGTNDAEVWDSGEVGGYECYLPHSAEEGQGDVAVYNTNDVNVRSLYQDRPLSLSKVLCILDEHLTCI